MSEILSEREQKHLNIARKAAAEGMVLLENDGVLPLTQNAEIALYGGGAKYPVIGGSGSGSVNVRSFVNLYEGLKNAGLIIASEGWLTDFDERYEKARKAWKEKIFEDAGEPGDFGRLYRSYATHPFSMPEGLPVTKVSETCDIALYVITRTSGEGADRKAVKGDYYLSEQEEAEIEAISRVYPKLVLILNVGGIIDLSILDRTPVSAVVLMSQAGMASGDALADVLTGKVPFSGHLTDTWAYRYEDYPSSPTFSHNNGNIIEEKYTDGIYVGYRYFDTFGIKPRYPFGYGLSCTEFAYEVKEVILKDSEVTVTASVKNTGARAGKQVLQLYAACPGGKRGREVKRLAAFKKTGLLAPGESCCLDLTFSLSQLELYHTAEASWKMEAGMYYLLLGENALDYRPAARLTLSETVTTEQLANICPLVDSLTEIAPTEEQREKALEAIKTLFSGKETALLNVDKAVREDAEKRTKTANNGDCIEGAGPETDELIEKILSELTLEEKSAVVCGQPSSGSNQVIGNAAIHVPGAAGETAGLLERFGLAPLILADGPAGLRLQKHYQKDPEDGHVYTMNRYESLVNRFFGTEYLHEEGISFYQYCTAIPIGTLLAQTWDPEVLEACGELIAREMKEFGVNLWLAPGMNIHRNPLCGRNYEYYSEDPLISGKMAAAVTSGIQRYPGCGVTIKHYACNNQEENRMGVSSIVSERALRELYLKGFEIAVKEAQPKAVMTSYNKINGVHTANSEDLCTEVLRNEWDFKGIVMTDWTTTNNGGGSSAAKCIAVGNDLIMPGNNSDIQEIISAVRKEFDLSLEEKALDTCVRRMLRMICQGEPYTTF